MVDAISRRPTGATFLIRQVSDEVNTLLDDNLVLTQQFSFSPYKVIPHARPAPVALFESHPTSRPHCAHRAILIAYHGVQGPFEERIADWERKLRLVQEVLSEWLSCQRNWMYLQPIFDSEDINRQLPAEVRPFARMMTIRRVRGSVQPKISDWCRSRT